MSRPHGRTAARPPPIVKTGRRRDDGREGLTELKLITSAFLWIFLYLVLALAPLVMVLVGETPPARDVWTELSVALGFVGLAILGLQFAISARSNGVDAPYGLDVVLQFHRQMSFVGIGLVLAHPLILLIDGSVSWGLLQVFDTTWAARMGVTSVVALLVLVAASLWRLQLRLSYEVWRATHDLLAVVVVVAALLHVELVGHYVAGLWRQVLWAAVSLSVVGLLVWVRLVKPLLLLRRPWVLDAVVPRGADVWSLQLRADGHDGMHFDAGQFAWLTVGRSPLRITEHPFSMSSSSERSDTVEFTIKAAGDFTSSVGDLEPGTVAYLDGPYGVFTLHRNEAPGFLFVAGGIGITPILSMLRTQADLGDRRRMALLYANPTLEQATFREELEQLSERLELEVVHVLEDPPEGWSGATGFVTAELVEAHLPERADRLECFMCGPPPMTAAVEQALRDNGVPLERIHNERFDFI